MAKAKKAETSAKKKTPSATRPRASKKKTNQTTKLSSGVRAFYSRLQTNFASHRSLYLRYLIVTLVIILITAFVFVKRSWFIAATVNNQPITTLELYQNLKSRYGQEILDELIRNKLISQEAARKGVSVAQGDIDKKIAEVEKQVGGKEALSAALSQRNLTQKDFETQIRTQLLVEKLLEKDITVSDKEVTDYIAQNPESTKGQSKDDVRSQLRSNKLNDKFTSWYASLQKNAKISKF